MRNFLYKNTFKKRSQRGLTLLETAMVLAVISISMAGMSLMLADNAKATKVKASAERMTEVTEATQNYVSANYSQLVTLADAGAPVVIPVGRDCATCAVPTGPGGLPSIQGGGFLPANFINVNPFQQRHAVLVREPTVGRLEVIVTTYGGTQLEDDDLGRLSASIGANGGAVYQNSTAAPSTQIVGAFGGWRTPAATWAGSIGATPVTPSPGRVQSALAFAASGGNMEDYLNRFNTGDPEHNRMRTAIDMNGFDVNNGNVIRSNYFSAAIDANIGRDVNATRDLNAGNNVTADVAVMATNSTATTYGQSMLRRWGLDNTTGDLYLRSAPGETVILGNTSNTASGNLLSQFQTNYFDGNIDANYVNTRSGSYNCSANAYDCRVYLSNEGMFRDLNDGWSRFYGFGNGMVVNGPAGQGNLEVQGYDQTWGDKYNRANSYTYGFNQNYAGIGISASDAVLYSNGSGRTHDMIGTYNGWDVNTIYIGGYNAYNLAGRSTTRVAFGGNGGPGEAVSINLSNGNMVTGTLFDRTNTAYYVNQAGTSRMNYIDVDSILLRGRSTVARLEDMIPRMVPQYSYVVVQNNWNRPVDVPKPACGAGGSPRIVVTPATLSANIKVDDAGGNVPFVAMWRAEDSGPGEWKVYLEFNPGIEPPAGNRANPLLAQAGIAMTYCYFP